MQPHTQLTFFLEFLFLACLTASSFLCISADLLASILTMNCTLHSLPALYDRFNQKVADRHIPVCSSIRAKPTMLLRGSGMGPGQATHSAHNKTYTSLTRNAF